MIKLISVKDGGLIDTERAIFRATEDGNVGVTVVMCCQTGLRDGKYHVKNSVLDTYWFIDKEVSAGETIVLYTKDPGSNYKVKELENGKKSHFFYWRRSEPMWGKPDVALVHGALTGWSSLVLRPPVEEEEPA